MKTIMRLLGSVRLAVVLLAILAAVMAAATFSESSCDAETAYRLVYGSTWFALLLGLLGVNVLCALLSRFPWKRHQAGFVLAHSGLLVLLAGALAGRCLGLEGSLPLREGQSSREILLDHPVLLHGPSPERLQAIPAEFLRDPPREGHEVAYEVGEGVKVVVKRSLRHARPAVAYVAQRGAPPAVRLRLHNAEREKTVWLSPAGGTVCLENACLSLRESLSPAETRAPLRQPEGDPGKGSVFLQLPDYAGEVPVSALEEGPQPLGASGYTARVLRSFTHFSIDASRRWVNRSREPTNPAVELLVEDRRGNRQRWLLFARFPEFNRALESVGEFPPIEAAYRFEPEGKPRERHIVLVLTPDGKLLYSPGADPPVTVEPGREVSTGWGNLAFRVEEVLPGARRVPAMEEDPSGQGPPAVQLRLEGAQDPGPHWLALGQTLSTTTGKGKPMTVGYGLQTADLGFAVKLVDFRVGYHPGTRSPASYQSIVEVGGERHRIAMNRPLKKGGYTIFQSSYQELGGKPVVSIFRVTRDPGIGLKYAGSLLIVLGIAMMVAKRFRGPAPVLAAVAVVGLMLAGPPASALEGSGEADPAPAPEKCGGTADGPGSVGDADGWVDHPGGTIHLRPRANGPPFRRGCSGRRPVHQTPERWHPETVSSPAGRRIGRAQSLRARHLF